jgi:hypothetical protein
VREKINLVDSLDDQGSPTTNLSAIRTLVESDHVFAIVPADTPFEEMYSNGTKWTIAVPYQCPLGAILLTFS